MRGEARGYGRYARGLFQTKSPLPSITACATGAPLGGSGAMLAMLRPRRARAVQPTLALPLWLLCCLPGSFPLARPRLGVLAYLLRSWLGRFGVGMRAGVVAGVAACLVDASAVPHASVAAALLVWPRSLSLSLSLSLSVLFFLAYAGHPVWP